MGQYLWGCHHNSCHFERIHLMNVGQRQTAADSQTKPTDLDCESTCNGLHCIMQKGTTASDVQYSH